MARAPRRGPIPAPSGWTRVWRILAPILYLGALAIAAYLTVSIDLRPPPAASAGGFDHSYPPNPKNVERPKVVGSPPSARSVRTIRRGHLSSLRQVAEVLPKGTVVRSPDGWLLSRPVMIAGSATVELTGGSLRLGPGSFLSVERGGTLRLAKMAIRGLGPAPSSSSPGDRGFLSAEEGGRLVLSGDRITNLGHPGVHSYGISFWAPAPGSGIWGSTITGNYFGVYTTHARGVTIAGDHVVRSAVYGIDPHTGSTRLTITRNTIVDSGLHAVILADQVTHSLVARNTIVDPADHGIVIFDRSDGNVVANNRIRGAFDGIVVDGSSSSHIDRNAVSAKRFGLRIAGSSAANVATANVFVDALVGAYVYGGAVGTILTDNRFLRTVEDVRVRSDAGGTLVRPIPANSEIGGGTVASGGGLPWWLPLSLLGVFVWGSWLIRQYLGSRYQARTSPFHSDTSVIVPVFREDRDVLERCLETWIANGVREVLLVIDHTEHDLIPVAQGWAGSDERVQVIVVEPPGKRHALVVGIRAAVSPIVLLTDSDTMWDEGFVEKMLCGFSDPEIGGVGCRQNVYRTGASLWRRVADWMLDVRFIHQLPAAARRDAIPCISGRTAAYRRDVILPVLDELEFETFLGRMCVSGDDGRLTWLVLRDGWGAAYQLSARAWTVFPDSFKGFLKQRVRWSRNSYRCYARAISRGWMVQEPAITSVTVIQNLVGPFTLTLAVFFLIRAMADSAWLVAAVTAAWLMLGRAIKGIGHLAAEPASFLYVPLVTIVFIVVMIPVKIFSLFTLNRQGWITRVKGGGVAEGQSGVMAEG